MVYSYFRTFNLPIIITNCSNNYGPNQHPEKLIPKLIYNILNNLPLPIYGNGKNSREWIHVQDHCKALLKVFKKGKIGPKDNNEYVGGNYVSTINLSTNLPKLLSSFENIDFFGRIMKFQDQL